MFIIISKSFEKNIIFTYTFITEDCRQQEGGPYYFKKQDSRTYKCVKDGPEFSCPDTWAIPSWYEYGSTDPCLCMSVPSIYGSKFVCPPDPMFGQRTTESSVTEAPVGAIPDGGKSKDCNSITCV